MAIVINDWFEVSASGPIDDRLVKDNISARDAIVKKYVGLKVYVKSEDKTYVYTSANQWKLDGGSSTTNIQNLNWTENIYGSGSVVGDFELFLGTVSNKTGDRSYYYNLWSRGLTDGDQSRILNYFYRNSDANDWDSMAFRMQHQLKPTGGATRSSSFIDFNPSLTMSGVPVYVDLETSILERKNIDIIGKNGIIISAGSDPFSDNDNNFIRQNNSAKIGIDSKNINFYFDRLRYSNFGGEELIPPISFFTMSKTDSYAPYTDVVFGLNSSNDPLQRYTISPFRSSYRMRMGSQLRGTLDSSNDYEKNLWSFDIRPANYIMDIQTWIPNINDPNQGGGFLEGVWQTALEIDNKQNVSESDNNSPVRLLVDDSSKDWDFASSRNPTLMTPLDIVRKLEHRYEKIQMLNRGSSYRIVNTFTTWKRGVNDLVQVPYNVIYLSTDGNSFDIVLPEDQQIHDILPDRSQDPTLRFPPGTIIYIKFINQNPLKPGSLRISDGRPIDIVINGKAVITPEAVASRIRSEITKATFVGFDESKLEIIHDTFTGNVGDNITLRHSLDIQNNFEYWDIISINREHIITKRPWILDVNQETTGTSPTNQLYWDFTRSGGRPGSATYPVRYLTNLSTTGIWQSLSNTTIINDGISRAENPGKYSIIPSTTAGSDSAGIKDQLTPDSYKFRFSVDGNRLVYCQGNFKIDGSISEILRTSTPTNNKLFFKTADNRKNVWNVGFIFTDTGYDILKPKWDTNWTRVRMYGVGKQSTGGADQLLTFSSESLSINKDGHIMLEFFVEPTNSGQLTNLLNVKIDVWVPPFSYHTDGPNLYQRNL